MTPEIMAAEAVQAIQNGTAMMLVVPRPWRNRPKKFPRGELACVNSDGESVYIYNPLKVLAWLVANGLVKVQTSVAPSAI